MSTSTDTTIPPTCATCGHTALECPECGGKNGYHRTGINLDPCYWCVKYKPRIGEDVVLEPTTIVGWTTGPDGIYEVATSGDRPIPTIPTIPREATPARRPTEHALYTMSERLADALQSRDWRQAEAALEEWRLLRADLERHVSSDEHDRKELIAWVAEMSGREPKIQFEAEFVVWLFGLIEKLVREGLTDEEGGRSWALKSRLGKAEYARSIATKCARAARVTGWRERGKE